MRKLGRKRHMEVLPEGSLFFGADPDHEVNEDLYNKFGTFFPFAVGSKSQISSASVLINRSYKMRSVFHLDLAYFLKEILGYTVYDALWIDAEGAEYGLFPYFYRGGKLDQYGITICQSNMEHLHVTTDPVPDQIHSPNEEKKELFKNFIFLQVVGRQSLCFFSACANETLASILSEFLGQTMCN
ncbi:unnamed protein product [Cylicocyclus nassatus]|uniref:Methyltransferase FkbM domain-containing protein n=1 Tax=Cylicocyclus nassatus TaxID=53992 RepID=A0AA36MDQ0_CYLNA|nr:unnamed protein product [Cylicocyclus nassatus]